MKIFTSGMLKTYLECPAKYNLIYNENIQIPADNSNSEIGNEIHALINYFYKGFDIKKMTDFVYNGNRMILKDLWENFLEIKPEKLLKSEYSFNIKIDDNSILTGRIDGLYKKGKSLIITDWKTGSDKIDTDTNMQTSVYLYSMYVLLKNINEINNFEDLSIEYYFLKTKKIKTVVLTKEFFEKIKKDIDSLIKEINEEKQYLRTIGPHCKNCIYKVFCDKAYG